MDNRYLKFRKGYISILLVLLPLFVQSQYNYCPNIDYGWEMEESVPGEMALSGNVNF